MHAATTLMPEFIGGRSLQLISKSKTLLSCIVSTIVLECVEWPLNCLPLTGKHLGSSIVLTQHDNTRLSDEGAGSSLNHKTTIK